MKIIYTVYKSIKKKNILWKLVNPIHYQGEKLISFFNHFYNGSILKIIN